MCLLVRRIENGCVKGPARDLEFTTLPVDIAQRFIPGNGFRDTLTELLVIAQRCPIKTPRRQHPFGKRRNDVDLGAYFPFDRRPAAIGHAHKVEHRFLRRGLGLFVTGQSGKDEQRPPPPVNMPLVEFCGDVDGKTDLLKRASRPVTIGVAGKEIPAEQKCALDITGNGGPHRGIRILTGGFGRCDVVQGLHL